jgi:hypothetical protein
MRRPAQLIATIFAEGKGSIMAIRKEILDELLKDYQKPVDLLGQSGLLQQLSQALI